MKTFLKFLILVVFIALFLYMFFNFKNPIRKFFGIDIYDENNILFAPGQETK